MAKRKPSTSPIAPTDLISARVVVSHGRHHFVTTADGKLYEAHRRGKKGDVVVGDEVLCSPASDLALRIESISPRRSLLFRSDQWRIKELASNVDTVVILFASRPSFNPWFVWKAILAARTAKIDCLCIRTKTDLEDTDEKAKLFAQELQDIGETVLSISSEAEPEATRQAISRQISGKTVVFIGQSGMGKSTLLNLLCPEANARTREFSEALDLGKQTTTATELYKTVLDGLPTFIIDSPGFQEFGLAHLSRADILAAMPDIAAQINGCRFYNCTHTNEPGCSVLNALKEGLISEPRHAFYKAMIQLSEK